MTVLKGNPVSPGFVLGKIHVHDASSFEPVENFVEKGEEVSHYKKYEQVKERALGELEKIRLDMEKHDAEKAKIFTAHQDILNDVAINEEIEESILRKYHGGDYALYSAYETFLQMIKRARDPVIAERYVDFEDVRKRLLRLWYGKTEESLSSLHEPLIIIAKDLLPSDTATLDRRNVLAIITETGGANSHSAIIARSYEIPAVLGITDLLEKVKGIGFIAVDAIAGNVFLDPDEKTKAQVAAKREEHLKSILQVKRFLKKEGKTSCGERIAIGLNIGSAGEDELAGAEFTDFAGLFRTEFLYMGRKELPSEDEQFEVYRKVLSVYGKRPVTLRTLDIGGDKTLDYMELPKEDNPFLGKRALRLCFSHIDIFKTQLRAALRASVFGTLNLMLPMVGSIDDIRQTKVILEEVKSELDSENISYDKNFKLGIMIEIPSIAAIADMAAEEVDFASIGTNDLCQYMCAVDRMNPEVAGYYQDFHPAMFRIIEKVAKDFNAAGKPLSVCGEMGGNPLSAVMLVGLGLRKLSMNISAAAQIKSTLSCFSIAEAEKIAHEVKKLSTAKEIEHFLREKCKTAEQQGGKDV